MWMSPEIRITLKKKHTHKNSTTTTAINNNHIEMSLQEFSIDSLFFLLLNFTAYSIQSNEITEIADEREKKQKKTHQPKEKQSDRPSKNASL